MPKRRDLKKEEILAAMGKTKSNRAAARYLNCSYTHYKMWAKVYEATEPGYDNLFTQHLNPSGKGIPKFLKSTGKEPPLLDIIEGRADASSFSPEKLKYRNCVYNRAAQACVISIGNFIFSIRNENSPKRNLKETAIIPILIKPFTTLEKAIKTSL